MVRRSRLTIRPHATSDGRPQHSQLRRRSTVAEGTQVQVEFYPSRLVVRNPGGLHGPVTVDQLFNEGISSSRNARLLRLLEDVPIRGTIELWSRIADQKRLACQSCLSVLIGMRVESGRGSSTNELRPFAMATSRARQQRKQALPGESFGAGDGNRTRVLSLGICLRPIS